MKKILMGTLGMAMAVTAFGETLDSTVAKAPVKGTIMVGQTSTETSIVLGMNEVNFGTLNLEVGQWQNNKGKKHTVTVQKQDSAGIHNLAIGEYEYKVGPSSDTWESIKGWAQTTAIDSHPAVFKNNATGETGALSTAGDAFSLNAVAVEGGVEVSMYGTIDQSADRNTYSVDANLYVALVDKTAN